MSARIISKLPIKIAAVTWNVAGKIESLNSSELLSSDLDADILIYGFEEFDASWKVFIPNSNFTSRRTPEITSLLGETLRTKIAALQGDTTIAEQPTIPNGYQLLTTETIGGIVIVVYAHCRILHLCSDVLTSSVTCGLWDVAANKGAVAVSLRIANKSFCFICAHLAAHLPNKLVRNRNYLRIMNFLFFYPGTKDSNTLYSSVNKWVSGLFPKQQLNPTQELFNHQYHSDGVRGFFTVFDHDYIIFLGDLNYRIEGLTATAILEAIRNEDYTTLRRHDQLITEMNAGRVLAKFQEAELRFPPSFKWIMGKNVYGVNAADEPLADYQDIAQYLQNGRNPAWCDRILFRSNSEPAIHCISYESLKNFRDSDHRPVRAVFSVDVDPREVFNRIIGQMEEARIVLTAQKNRLVQQRKKRMRILLLMSILLCVYVVYRNGNRSVFNKHHFSLF